MRALVTGATGFVGQRLCQVLIDRGNAVRGLCHRHAGSLPGVEWIRSEGLETDDTDWRTVLEGVDAVFHLAAAVPETVRGPEAMRRIEAINVAATVRLAEAAAVAGVSRFVFLSTAKVHGEVSGEGPFHESSPPSPADLYSQSKWRAELGIREVANKQPLRWTIIRPPLVYGPGVRGNFLRLMKLIDRRLPLPLGSVVNSRSLIHVDNLVDGVIHLGLEEEANARSFLLRDDRNVSSPELIRLLARSLGRRDRLWRFPPSALSFAARVCGKEGTVRRLVCSLTVDPTAAIRLGWRGVISLDEGIMTTGAWYRREVAP